MFHCLRSFTQYLPPCHLGAKPNLKKEGLSTITQHTTGFVRSQSSSSDQTKYSFPQSSCRQQKPGQKGSFLRLKINPHTPMCRLLQFPEMQETWLHHCGSRRELYCYSLEPGDKWGTQKPVAQYSRKKWRNKYNSNPWWKLESLPGKSVS